MSTQAHPTPDQIIAARRARLAAEARNAELSLAAWEHECAERAQQNTGTPPVRSARILRVRLSGWSGPAIHSGQLAVQAAPHT